MKNISCVLDTSILLVMMDPHDPMYMQTKEKLFSITYDTVHFEIPIICAIEGLIQNPHPEDFIAKLSVIVDKRDFELTQKSDLEYISTLPLKIRTTLKANDCSVLAISKRLNAQLLTLDKKLLKAYSNL